MLAKDICGRPQIVGTSWLGVVIVFVDDDV